MGRTGREKSIRHDIAGTNVQAPGTDIVETEPEGDSAPVETSKGDDNQRNSSNEASHKLAQVIVHNSVVIVSDNTNERLRRIEADKKQKRLKISLTKHIRRLLIVVREGDHNKYVGFIK